MGDREKKGKKKRRALRSVGSFMNKLLQTLGSVTHPGSLLDDDDGGFRECQPPHPDRQPPLRYRADRTPGVQGLKNHGNTCFMNAVVQCLSNTEVLAEHLCAGPEAGEARGAGSGGTERVTERLAELVCALWSGDYTPQLSAEFKSTVSKYGAQFQGNSQHDALEFLLWLLDRLHEDGNLSGVAKVACRLVNMPARSPARGPANPHYPHSHGSLSFIQQHFQAQYKSTLTCPLCQKQSSTYDPFLCISLPIPLRHTRALCVTLVFNAKGQKYLRVGLAVPVSGSLACLRRMVADEGKLSPEQVILTEVYPTGFQRSFFDDEDLSTIVESDVLYAFQAPPLCWKGAPTSLLGYHHSLPSSPYSGSHMQRLPPSGTLSSEYLHHSGSAKVILLVCNTAGTGRRASRFGPPFLLHEERGVSWERLQLSILSRLHYLMLPNSSVQSMGELFRVRVVGGSAHYSYLCPDEQRPLSHPAVERCLRLCGPGGPPHVKLVVEWDLRIKERLFGRVQEEVVQDCDSVRLQQQQHLQQHSCTLDDCFQLYTMEEQLAPDDAWKCPHCQRLQQGTVQLSLWTLPDILVLHLKRFRQVGEQRHKLTTLVRFPLSGLDMAPHAGPSERRRPNDCAYDLYAVCNHHGGMHGGHYTAYCRNSVDGQWYSYDDSMVEVMSKAEVCTHSAYILFYQRRSSIPPWSASSSPAGSSSSSASDHWALRVAAESRSVSRASSPCVTRSPRSSMQKEEPLQAPPASPDAKPLTRSNSARSPHKAREGLSRLLPLRWSFGSKERPKPRPVELVEYLESGRRPRCTEEPIVSLMTPAVSGHVSPGSPRPVRDNCKEPDRQSGGHRDSRDSVHQRISPGSPKWDFPNRNISSQPGSPRVPSNQPWSSRMAGSLPGSPNMAHSEPHFYRTASSQSGLPRMASSQSQTSPIMVHSKFGFNKKPVSQSVGPVMGGIQSGSHGLDSSQSGVSAMKPGLMASSQPGSPHTSSRDGELGRRREAMLRHESLLSFLKPGFLRREVLRKTVEGNMGIAPKHCFSNGLANGTVPWSSSNPPSPPPYATLRWDRHGNGSGVSRNGSEFHF